MVSEIFPGPGVKQLQSTAKQDIMNSTASGGQGGRLGPPKSVSLLGGAAGKRACRAFPQREAEQRGLCDNEGPRKADLQALWGEEEQGSG